MWVRNAPFTGCSLLRKCKLPLFSVSWKTSPPKESEAGKQFPSGDTDSWTRTLLCTETRSLGSHAQPPAGRREPQLLETSGEPRQPVLQDDGAFSPHCMCAYSSRPLSTTCWSLHPFPHAPHTDAPASRGLQGVCRDSCECIHTLSPPQFQIFQRDFIPTTHRTQLGFKGLRCHKRRMLFKDQGSHTRNPLQWDGCPAQPAGKRSPPSKESSSLHVLGYTSRFCA